MALTYFYAEWFGLLISVIALAMLANRRTMLEAIREMIGAGNRAVLFLAAILTLLLGLLLVLTHNIWTGNALTIVVTLLGWAFILRAVLLLFLPHSTLEKLFGWIRLEQVYYVVGILALVLGVWMSWAGFAGLGA